MWALLKEGAQRVAESPGYLMALEALLQGSPEVVAASVPAARSDVEALSQSASIEVRALALAWRIRAHDAGSLAHIAAEARTIADSRVNYSVAVAVEEWRSSDPRGLAALGALSQAKDARVLSAAAASALMRIHTKDVVPFLAVLLSSTDQRLRDFGVRGLSLFVRGAPVVTAENTRAMAYLAGNDGGEFLDSGIAPFVTVAPAPAERETEFVEAWKAWWGRVSARIESQP